MREFARMGLSPTVFCANTSHLFEGHAVSGSSQVETVDGIEICWLKIRPYRGAKSIGRILSWIEFEWRLWRLPKAQFERPQTIIISSLSLFTILTGLFLRRHYRCRLIFEVRDIWPLTLVAEGGFSRWNPLVMMLQWIEKLGYRRSDAIVGTMPNLQQHVYELINSRPPVFCIPMGVDDGQLASRQALPEGYRQEHIPVNKFIVCHAGTIGGTNALGTLLHTARLMRDNPHIHFLIVGEGDLRSDYSRSVADLPNITFAPAVPKTMVHSLLQECDLLYFATYRSKVWDYGQSLNKVVDYMLAGKPIVASHSGYPSMINEAHCGSFVPSEDATALCDALTKYSTMNKEELADMGSRATDWIMKNRNYKSLGLQYAEIIGIR